MATSTSGPPIRLDEDYHWTPRQKQVLELITRGYTNGRIGEELGVSLDGAKWHVREILSKLGVDTREEAAEYWRAYNGLGTRLTRLFRGFMAAGTLRWTAVGAAVLVGASGIVLAALLWAGNDTGGDEGPQALAPPSETVPPEPDATVATSRAPVETPDPSPVATATPAPASTTGPVESSDDTPDQSDSDDEAAIVDPSLETDHPTPESIESVSGPSSVHVVVLDAISLDPVSGAFVEVSAEGLSATGTSDAEGTAAIDLSPFSGSVSVGADGVWRLAVHVVAPEYGELLVTNVAHYGDTASNVGVVLSAEPRIEDRLCIPSALTVFHEECDDGPDPSGTTR